MVEKGAADQMRRVARHGADADIDARLAEIDRRKLRMRVGQMQNAHIAEAADVVQILVGRQCDARNGAGRRRGGAIAQEITAIQVALHFSRAHRSTE